MKEKNMIWNSNLSVTKEWRAWELVRAEKRKAAFLPFKKITDYLNQNPKIIV